MTTVASFTDVCFAGPNWTLEVFLMTWYHLKAMEDFIPDVLCSVCHVPERQHSKICQAETNRIIILKLFGPFKFFLFLKITVG